MVPRNLVFSLLSIPLLANAKLAEPETWSQVEPVLVEYCFGCHDSLSEEGDFNLEILETDFLNAQSAGHWIEVMDNLNASEMPPEDEPQPSAEERAMVAEWVAAELRHARARANATGGKALLRRLTRAEYENTVRDLLGVVFAPKQNPLTLLPPDGAMHGFDKVSLGLVLDPSLMDRYFEVAQIVADQAVQLGDPPVPTIRSRLESEEYETGITSGSIHRELDRTKELSPDGSGVITFHSGFRTFGQLKHPSNDRLVPVSGTYAIRFRAGTDPGDSGKPVLVELKRSGTGTIFYGEIEGTPEDPSEHEVVMELDAKGGGELSLNLVEKPGFGGLNRYERRLDKEASELSSEGKMQEAGFLKARLNAEGSYGMGRADANMLQTGDHPRLYLDFIEIEGPLYEQWPPRSVGMLLPRGLDESQETAAYLREIIAQLLPRAYRRPVTAAEIERIFAVAHSEWRASGSFETGIKAAIVTTLCSPSFLYLLEPEQLPLVEPSPEAASKEAGEADSRPGPLQFLGRLLRQETGPESRPGEEESASVGLRPLTGFELAARLSYFLWSTMPDEELLQRAKAGTLRDNLDAQVTRMLDDERAGALVEGFARQWLKAAEFDRFEPDKNAYKRYYANEFKGINEDLNEEPIAFFREIMRSGGDLRDFLSSDWTMVNERLAKWYSLPADLVEGEEFVRVSLPADSLRGGLIGMGAVHKWGSDGNRTKPVDRGKYVLEVLFNDPPNPAPPNVGEVEPNVEGEKLTVRQRLEAHRQIESCANCHSRLDPYGLALENFNVVGEWREYQDGENRHWGKSEETRIDASGTLPNGASFENFREYKAALRALEDRFFRGFSEKLFTYAFSRIPEPVDRGTVDTMVAALQASNGQIESAVRAIVCSETFHTK